MADYGSEALSCNTLQKLLRVGEIMNVTVRGMFGLLMNENKPPLCKIFT